MITQQLGFNEALDIIFERVRQDVTSNLAAAEAGRIPQTRDRREQLELADGGIDVYERLDENGNYHFEKSQYAPGLTIKLKVTILSPDDTYSAKLWSDGEGGGQWDNVHINQQQSLSIKTNVFSSTTVKLDVHANTGRNVDFHARVDYSL